jgi:hypothetical protein
MRGMKDHGFQEKAVHVLGRKIKKNIKTVYRQELVQTVKERSGAGEEYLYWSKLFWY